MPEPTDFYRVLGVSKDATEEEIRRSYRKLAREHHPDVNPGKPEAEDKFKAIAAAYEVLSNKERRALYDEFGHEGLRSGFDPAQARSYARWDAQKGAGGGEVPFDFDLSDLMGRRRTGQSAFPMDGQDLLAQVQLDFATALLGTELELHVPAHLPCDACAGSGQKADTKRETCPTCAGAGRTEVVRGPLRMTAACVTCGGSGTVAEPCPQCLGQGYVETTQTVRVRIPKGAADGDELRVRGKGAPGLYGGAPGDVVIRTHVTPHAHFSRDGLDLRLRLPITLSEAYLGASIRVPTPSGAVQMKIPPRTQQGAELRLKGKGVKRGDAQGDLYVRLEVRLPTADDPALAAAIASTEQFYAGDVRDGVAL